MEASQPGRCENGRLQTQPLSILRLTVKPDRVVGTVKVAEGFSRYATPELIAEVCRTLPTLPEHTCKNDEGDTFSQIMCHTSIPHLFEHMVIDIQVRLTRSTKSVFVATSEWIDESEGTAQIEVSFTDDLDALRAFRDAAQILNKAMV